MKLNNLKSNKGSRTKKFRVGRGMAQGKGKQAGKGQSGQNKRGGTRPGFEGGQNPWFRRLPKRGFKSINKIEYRILNLSDLEKKFKDGDIVNFETLKAVNLMKKKQPIKLLANGNLTKKLTINVNKISVKALEIIKKTGGKLEVS